MPKKALPIIGGDSGLWAHKLNDFLRQLSPSATGGINVWANRPTKHYSFLTNKDDQLGADQTGLTGVNTATNVLERWDGSAWQVLLDGNTSTSSLILQDSDGDTKIEVEQSNNENIIRFSAGGSEQLVIDNYGGVGIGTSVPTSTLDINGVLTLRGVTSPSPSLPDNGRIYFDYDTKKFRVSQNGENYVDLLGSSASVAAGTTGQIQFNSNGEFAASPDMAWDNTLKTLTTAGNLIALNFRGFNGSNISKNAANLGIYAGSVFNDGSTPASGGNVVIGATPGANGGTNGVTQVVKTTTGDVVTAFDASANLPIERLNGGLNASTATFLRGDGVWAEPTGSGASNPNLAIRNYTWTIGSPSVGGILGPRIPVNQTVMRIDAYVSTATSVSFNIEERSVIGSAGTNLMSAEQIAGVNGAAATTGFADTALAAGNWLYLDISAVAGAPAQLVVSLTVSVN